jgi:hypothetical protein
VPEDRPVLPIMSNLHLAQNATILRFLAFALDLPNSEIPRLKSH